MEVKRARNLILGFAAFAVMFSFQNCNKVTFDPAEQVVQSSTTAPVPTTPMPPAPTPTPNPTPAPIPSQSPDPREIDCGPKFVGISTAITYDRRTLRNPPAVNVTEANLAGGPNLDIENVNLVHQIRSQINLTAANINTIGNFDADIVDFNAQNVREISNFRSNRILMVTRRLGIAQLFNADFCISAQQIDYLHGLTGKLSVFGRNENGQKAVVRTLGQISGFVSLYDIEVQSPLSGSNYQGKLVNSRLVRIDNSDVDIILQDSVIDEVVRTRGTIRLRGNSRVLRYDDQIRIVRE